MNESINVQWMNLLYGKRIYTNLYFLGDSSDGKIITISIKLNTKKEEQEKHALEII